MYVPNPKHEFLIWSCDWKESPDRATQRKMLNHAQKVDGYFDELNVYSGDERVFYSGPEGIEDWIKNGNAIPRTNSDQCAMELFVDYSCSALSSVEKYYFDETNVWVLIGKREDWNGGKYSKWYLMDFITWKMNCDFENIQEEYPELISLCIEVYKQMLKDYEYDEAIYFPRTEDKFEEFTDWIEEESTEIGIGKEERGIIQQFWNEYRTIPVIRPEK